MSFRDKLKEEGPRKLLALDCGGMRGIFESACRRNESSGEGALRSH